MKVAFVFVADGNGDFFYRKGRAFEQKCRLREAFFLQVFGVGFAGTVLNFVAEPIKIIMQNSCRLGEGTVVVILFDVAENIHNCFILAALVGKLIGVVQKLHKEQSHGGLIDVSFVGRVIDQGPNQVLNQVLNRENIGNLKV